MPPIIEFQGQTVTIRPQVATQDVRLRLRDGTYYPEAGRRITLDSPWTLTVQPGSDARVEYRAPSGQWAQAGVL